MRFRIVINGDKVATWTGFVFSDCIDDAQEAACKIAEKMGGSFLDIVKVELVE